MMHRQGESPADLSGAVGLEEQLASVLSKAVDGIAHTESLDCEQRAEIYEILAALRSDTQAHTALARHLAGCRETGNA